MNESKKLAIEFLVGEKKAGRKTTTTECGGKIIICLPYERYGKDVETDEFFYEMVCITAMDVIEYIAGSK